MYYFPDFLVLCCLFTCGFLLGYYLKFVYIYDNLWGHWYAVVGIAVALVLAGLWALKKHIHRQYRFEHFYVVFYGLMCFIISSCFMLTDNLDISFYFGFIGLSTIYLPCFSYIGVRSSHQGSRPAHVALGNTFFFGGVTAGFALFNELEPEDSGWAYLALTLTMLIGTVGNEVFQHFGVHDYKQSYDLSFHLMNEEKLVFLPKNSVYATFVGREDFYLVKNRQLLVAGLSSLLVVERVFLYSASYLGLSWSSTTAYMGTQHLYGPFLLYTVGCALGCALMLRYKPKLIYLMMALIKITATAAILGVYDENMPQNCFPFLCFYYISMGVYSSIALTMVLECTPLLFTEVGLGIAFALELSGLETLTYELNVDNSWTILLAIGVSAAIVTALAVVVVQFFLPRSRGLIDVRNTLLGVRRYPAVSAHTNIWHSNHFLRHDLPAYQLKTVKFDGKRVFQQYPGDTAKKSKL